MAETRKITIEILNTQVEKKDEEASNQQEVNDNKGKLQKLLHPIKTVEKAIFGKNVFLNQAYQKSKELVVKTLNASANQYFSLSEDYFAETAYKNISTGIGKATSLGSTVVSGAIVGGVGGAIVSGVVWVAGEFIQNQATLSSYHQSLNAANYQSGFSRTRSGLVDNGRGTEN